MQQAGVIAVSDVCAAAAQLCWAVWGLVCCCSGASSDHSPLPRLPFAQKHSEKTSWRVWGAGGICCSLGGHMATSFALYTGRKGSLTMNRVNDCATGAVILAMESKMCDAQHNKTARLHNQLISSQFKHIIHPFQPQPQHTTPHLTMATTLHKQQLRPGVVHNTRMPAARILTCRCFATRPGMKSCQDLSSHAV